MNIQYRPKASGDDLHVRTPVPASSRHFPDELAALQRSTFEYFWSGNHPESGLPRDRLQSNGEPVFEIASVGGVGFAFLALVVGAHNSWINRREALERASLMLVSLGRVRRFHGAFPHFVHAQTGKVIPFAKYDDGGDLVETALLIQGLICAREYFSEATDAECLLRATIDKIVQGVEWDWYTKGQKGPLWWHWSPRHAWTVNLPIVGWNEALICYVLAAGSAKHAIDAESYHSGWARNGAIANGNEYMGVRLPLGEPFGGPLFLSQYSFCTLDPRDLSDPYCEDYSEQVQAHTLINYMHCRKHYAEKDGWGLSACDGPKGYSVNSPTSDSGVIAPTAALSSMPFLPVQASEAARHFMAWNGGGLVGRFGLMDSFEPSSGWVSKTHLAIDQGPIVAMMENHRSGLLWKLFMNAPEVRLGLKRLGFQTKAGGARAGRPIFSSSLA